MTRDEAMILRGWAWRTPVDRPGHVVLVSPSEQCSLGHDLRFKNPKGDEKQITFEERRKIPRVA